MGKLLEKILEDIGIESFGEKADKELAAKRELRKIVLDEKVRNGFIDATLAKMIKELDSMEFPKFVLGIYLIEEISYHLALYWSEYNHLVDVFLEIEEPENVFEENQFATHKATIMLGEAKVTNMDEQVWLEEARKFKAKMDTIIREIFRVGQQ